MCAPECTFASDRLCFCSEVEFGRVRLTTRLFHLFFPFSRRQRLRACVPPLKPSLCAGVRREWGPPDAHLRTPSTFPVPPFCSGGKRGCPEMCRGPAAGERDKAAADTCRQNVGNPLSRPVKRSGPAPLSTAEGAELVCPPRGGSANRTRSPVAPRRGYFFPHRDPVPTIRCLGLPPHARCVPGRDFSTMGKNPRPRFGASKVPNPINASAARRGRSPPRPCPTDSKRLLQWRRGPRTGDAGRGGPRRGC